MIIKIKETIILMLKIFKLRLIINILFCFIGPFFNFLSIFILIKFLNAIFLNKHDQALLLIISYGLIWIISRVIPIFQNKLSIPINAYLCNMIATKIMERFYSLHLDYQLLSPAGKLSLLISKTYYSIIKLFPNIFSIIIPTFIEAISSTMLLTYLYGPVGLIQIIIMIVYLTVSFIGANKFALAKKKEIDQGFIFIRHYQSAFNNYENTHYFGNVNFEINRFKIQSKLFSDSQIHTFSLTEKYSIFELIILGFGFSFIMIFLAIKILSGIIILSEFFIISLYISQFTLSLNKFSMALKDFQSAFMDAKIVIKFINTSQEKKIQGTLPLNVNKSDATVEFRDVSFSYGGKMILNNINFCINPGQKVAIIGLSGEGKSTILKLLFRFYETNSGNILINGQDIKNVTLDSLRSSIAVIPQNPVMFNSSILDNIKYGNMHASLDSIHKACYYAGLSDFISQQELGIYTKIGENGNKVSGGQRQRIAIARAILKKSPIFIFDEATASLDTRTEREIQNNLDYISSGHTTIITTHNFRNILNADKIIYLKNGEIYEQGNYQELMRLKGAFYQQVTTYDK